MITIVPKSDFRTVPWKNGKGQTIELAINEGGSLVQFDWRLSMATVVEDGEFSNFSGYHRNLVLIEGNGLTLTHDIIHTDRLTKLLDFASFDGGSNTQAQIINGAIKDFNIMTAKQKCHAIVQTFIPNQTHKINEQGLVFAYSLTDKITIKDEKGQQKQVTQGDLIQLDKPQNIELTGQSLILINIQYL